MTIPRTIHQIWLGDQRRRPSHLIDTWRKKNPHHAHILWTEDNLPTLRNEHHFAEYYRHRCFVGCADILRWEVLVQHGGVYLDADTFCLRELDEFVHDREFLFSYSSDGTVIDKRLATSPLGCRKEHPFARHILERITGLSLTYHDTGQCWKQLGNLFITKEWSQWPVHIGAIHHAHFLPTFSHGGWHNNRRSNKSYHGALKVYAEHIGMTTSNTRLSDVTERDILESDRAYPS